MFATLRNIGFVVLLFYVWYVLCNDKNKEEKSPSKKSPNPSSEIFVPTKEWQVVKKGQPIPPGLHVRMNLETGVTEAKLIDPNEKQDKSRGLTEVPQKTNDEIVENSKIFKPSELKEALKNIKSDEIINPDELKQLTKKFRKYEDLKKELGQLNLIPKTEAELLTEIINELKSTSNEKRPQHILKLLEDLDFLVHQIDNAFEFVKQNGFADIVYKNLNSSDAKIKSESLKLFSTLVQNNPKVKVEAVETGCISLLLKILSLDSNEVVKARAVTALSCLLRRFPYAQLKFVENGGLAVVMKLFDSDNVKIKVKLATLISDLLIETKDMEGDEEYHIKEQYDKVGLEKLLLEQEWCENLQKLLSVLIVVDSDGHDSIEKCLLSIKAIVGKCSDKFQRDLLEKLEKHYKLLAVMDEGKDEEISNTSYFNDLSLICTEILHYLPDATKTKTEL